MIRRFSGLMAAVALLATAVVGLSAPEASAAYCGGSGVGVVVDFGALGGGVTTGCGSAGKASGAFASAGISLEQDSQEPGFVCRVQSKPAPGEECLATNAYWALFVAKQGGAWKYATQGVYTQAVKSGDSVAFVWQDSNARTAPGTAPQPVVAPSPTATTKAPTTSTTRTSSAAPKATASGTSKATKKSTKAASTASATPTASASTTPSGSASSSASAPPSAASSTAASTPSTTSTMPTTDSLSAAPTSATTGADTSTESGRSGLPGWVGPLVVVALVGIATTVLLVRKRAPKAP